MFAKTIRLENFRLVGQSVKVNDSRTTVLLEVIPNEDGTPSGPKAPSNSIFGDGSKVLLQFGEGWYVVNSLILEDYPIELVTKLETRGGTTRQYKYYAVRGIEASLLVMLKYGKKAMPHTVEETLAKRATKFLVEKILTPPLKGVGVWTPWTSNPHLDFDQTGYGLRMARKIWKMAANAMVKEGIKLGPGVYEAVLNKPWFMNGVKVWMMRNPVHDSDTLMTMRVVITDSPLATNSVTPQLMKAALGDRDGDANTNSTGERKNTLLKFLSVVQDNIDNNRDCGPLPIHGLDFKDGSSLGIKGDKSVDVNLQNVLFDKGNLWNDFQGFKTKGSIGLILSQIWNYAWAFARLLSEEELITLAEESAGQIPEEEFDTRKGSNSKYRRNLKIQYLKASMVKAKGGLRNQLRAQLAKEICFRVFGLMVEHMFDARKGTKLAYDPIDCLKALGSTGRFDFEGMKAEGIWTSPLEMVEPRIWMEGVNKKGEPIYRYSLRELIGIHDPIYSSLVCGRNKGWKNGNESIYSLMELIKTEGLDPIMESLYLQGEQVHPELVDIPSGRKSHNSLGEIYNLLEGAKMGRKFAFGPKNMAEVIEFVKKCGFLVEFFKDKEGGLNIRNGKTVEYLGTFKVIENLHGFGDGSISPYRGHIIVSDTTRRACPPVLIAEELNPFCTMEGALVQEKPWDEFPGLDQKRFTVLNFYGILAHLIVGAGQNSLTEEQTIRKAGAEIRRFVQGCELVRNEEALSVFGDMITVDIRKSDISSDWYSLAEDYIAKAVYEAGFSLYAVCKNNPVSKFLYVDKKIGVSRMVAAYDTFWPLRTERRFDREALSVCRSLRGFTSPVTPNVGDNLGVGDTLNRCRQMVRLAFFNTGYNAGGHDPVDFTPSGMIASASNDIQFTWMSLLEKDEYLESLEPEYRKFVNDILLYEKSEGRAIKRLERIDEGITITQYRIPTELGEEDVESMTFKANFPGTKSMVSPMGVQLVASYTPIRSYAAYLKRLNETGSAQVFLIDGVMPSDTIVGKKAWSLVANAVASQLEGGFILETSNPEEIISEIIPEIGRRLKDEGKSSDGKMYIYRLEGESIVSLKDGKKVLKAVCGMVPMYRIPFETGFGPSMTKFRKGGLEKLGHSERTLVGEVPIITQDTRDEMAILIHDLEQAIGYNPEQGPLVGDFEL